MIKKYYNALRLKLNLITRVWFSKKDSRKGDAFLIVSPSRSGSKMLTRFFINGGCSGNGEGEQLYEYRNPNVQTKRIVWKTNMPYNLSKLGNFKLIYCLLRELGYKVTIIRLTREMDATMESQVRDGTNKADAYKNILFCEKWLDENLKGKDVVKVDYENFVEEKSYRKTLAVVCGIKHRDIEEYSNQNIKHGNLHI